MPIYEFYSPDTHKIYSFYARRLMPMEAVPRCPDQKGKRMERLVSRFAFIGRAKEPTTEGASDQLDLDPRQEAAMMELASEMEGMGEENPDPRQLGRLMRRAMEISGQQTSGGVEEMLRRLESGEDPEKLEEEFGDAFEELDMPGEGQSGHGLKAALARRLNRAPSRDPKLYEISEYL